MPARFTRIDNICSWLHQRIDLTVVELDNLQYFPREIAKSELSEIRNKITKFMKILDNDLYKGEKENCRKADYLKFIEISTRIISLITRAIELKNSLQ